LVTGSRFWTDQATVWEALNSQIKLGPMTLVHGDAPGADEIADEWGQFILDKLRFMAVMYDKDGFSLTIEKHPARKPCETPGCWDHSFKALGKGAGPIRNQVLVDRGADICLAFPLPDSRGTFDCIHRAKYAGIPIEIFKPEGE
jgi:YspA, cpYpsA-related SLOG family